MATQNNNQPGLFDTPPIAARVKADEGERPRYFRDVAYRRKIDDCASLRVETLWRTEIQASVLARNPANEEQVAEGSAAYRARVKYNILQLLDRLSETMPTRDAERVNLQERIQHYRDLQRYGNSSQGADAAKTIDDIKLALQGACMQLNPPYLPANPQDGAMLRRQTLDPQLRYVREVYQAAAKEALSGNSFMSHIPNSAMLPVLREMGDLLALEALRRALDNDAHHYRQLVHHPNPRMRDADWGPERAETLGAMRQHVEEFVQRIKPDRMRRLQSTEHRTAGVSQGKPGTIADLLTRLQHADTLDAMLNEADALHTHVAIRANHIKDDLAAAYSEDYRLMNQKISRARRKDEPVAHEYNPFLREEEPIRAGYEARWCQIAHQAMTLMDRYKGSLRDLELKPLDRLEKPVALVKGTKTSVGKTAAPPQEVDRPID